MGASAVPFVASGHSGVTFEIDEVEALPDEDAGVLDLHEGASDFVPVEHARHPHEGRPSGAPAGEPGHRDPNA